MKRRKVNEEKRKRLQLINTSLIGFCAVAITQILTLENLDIFLTISMYCFALSLPFLVARFFQLLEESYHKYTINVWYNSLITVVAMVVPIVGIGAIFLHFSWTISIVFLLGVIIAFLIFVDFLAKIETANKDD